MMKTTALHIRRMLLKHCFSRYSRVDLDDNLQLDEILRKGKLKFQANLKLSEEKIKEIEKKLVIPLNCLDVSYVRSQGPGGQKVNKTASKAVVKLDINKCEFLDEETKEKIRENCGSRINGEGMFITTSQKTREQHKNLEDAISTMKRLIAINTVLKGERVLTLPEEDEVSRAQRLQSKRRRKEVKSLRGKIDD